MSRDYAVIFDMDGVLIDSHKMIWGAFNNVLGRYGVHLNDEDIQLYLGKSMRDDLVLWNKRFGLRLEEKQFTEDTWKIQEKILEGIKPDSELIRLLDNLKDKKVKMGVGTGSKRPRVEEIISHLDLGKYFPVIVTATDVARHKPEPDLFLEVARKLEARAENCVVIEDAADGIEAARRGGMKTIGYINGRNNAAQVTRADLVMRSFSELNYEKIINLFN